MVDKMKHIFIVLPLTTKSVLKYKKKHAVHNKHRLAWGTYARDSPGNYPACPRVKTAQLIYNKYDQTLLSIYTVLLMILIMVFLYFQSFGFRPH